jgi:hypothetical protein
MLARELLVAGRKEIEKYLNSLGVDGDIKLEGIQSGWKNKRIIKRVPQLVAAGCGTNGDWRLEVIYYTKRVIYTMVIRFAYGKGWWLSDYQKCYIKNAD